MPVTAFTSRVKNAGKRRDECGDRGVEEKKLPPPSYIICCTADWYMFVPRWEIFTSEYIFQWDKRFNKHSNHKHRHIWYQEHACSPCTVHLHAILEPRHIYEPPKSACMQKKKKKDHNNAKEQTKTKKKLLTNSFVFQSMRGAELCMQKNRNAKKQNHTMQYPWSLRSVCKTINYCQQISTSIETAFMH